MTKAATDFRVRGLVQGVGFRPTVYRIALELGLSGTVWNDAEGVVVHLEGESEVLERFPEALLAGKVSMKVLMLRLLQNICLLLLS